VSSLGVSASGVRLLLVCAEVAEGMADVVEALTQPGRGVDVLQVGMLDSADGPPLLDVSPVRRQVHARTPAPAPVKAPVLDRAPVSVPTAASQLPPQPVEPVEAAAPTRALPVLTPEGIPTRVSTGVRMPAPAVPASNGALGPESVATGVSHLAGAAPSRTPAYGPDARLVALAAARGGSVVLVWWRRRRDVVHEARLHADGSIELADGTRVMDPSAAAEIASGSHAPIDGWQVWRIGDREGLSLADAVGPSSWS